MKRLADPRGILALDPNSYGHAFVYFLEGEVLDWGVSRLDLAELLAACPADVVVIEDWKAPGSLRRARICRVLRDVARYARARGIEVVTVERMAVRQSWIARGRTTKHLVANAIADAFPVLEILVPRFRKPYRSEQTRADIFDAASLAIHAYGTTDEEATSLAAREAPTCVRSAGFLIPPIHGKSVDGTALMPSRQVRQRDLRSGCSLAIPYERKET